MYRVISLASKDLVEIIRDRKIFLFLLIMPITFTLLFGLAFSGGFGGESSDARLAVGYLDQDDGSISAELYKLLASSSIIRLVSVPGTDAADLESQVANGDLAAAVIVPVGYSQAARTRAPLRLQLIADPSSSGALSVQSEVMAVANRLINSVYLAQIIGQARGYRFKQSLPEVLAAWEEPPIRVEVVYSLQSEEAQAGSGSFSHTSPGMMLQFGIAGLMTAAQIIVTERKSRSLQRLLTTATTYVQILIGHYLAIFTLIFMQFITLIVFGQLILKVNYLRDPLASLVVAGSAAACISALGLLIGILAKSEDQAVIFSLIPMFIFSGLGGAWMPLEFASPTFQAIGHISPIAWAMDGFKNIVIRGLGLESVWVPVAALFGYAILFFSLATWRLTVSEER